jgi:CRP/FNR family transcriptional regulator, cyclic AMP receptor protein
MHFDNAERWKRLPLFPTLQRGACSALTASVQERTCRRGAIVVEAGEPAAGLYVIIAGRVRLLLDDGDGRELTIGTLGAGEFFGESSVIAGAVHTSTIEAEEPCELAFIPRDALLQHVLTDAGAASEMLAAVVARLTAAHGSIARLGLRNVYGRVVCVMLEQARESGGEWIVNMSSTDIASMVGASREMVSRVVKDLIERRIVRRRKRRLVILDRAALVARESFQRPGFARPRSQVPHAAGRASIGA